MARFSGQSISNLWVTIPILSFGVLFVAFSIYLLRTRPSETGSPLDPSFYVVVGLFGIAGVLCFVAVFRFPYRVRLSERGLEVFHLHRREFFSREKIKSIELRGDLVSRNVWIVLADGEERPLGVRSQRLVRLWKQRYATSRSDEQLPIG